MDQVLSRLLAVQFLLVSAAFANTLYFQAKTELVCPDNKHSCNSDTTCCLLPDGQYGCCMFANAVCCSDNIHCCPTGSYCDVNTGSCDKDGVKFEWSKKAPAALYIPKVKNQPSSAERTPPRNVEFQQPQSIPWAVKLPGLKLNSLNFSSLHAPASCSVSQTLCKSDSGLSGCCPFPNAVCCDKGQQCCPSGFQCNLKSSKCEKPTEETTEEMSSLLPGHTLFAIPDPAVCSDMHTVCPKNMTCCSTGNDTFGCCPRPRGVCCADHIHCCAHGYTCGSEKCIKKQVDMILVKMTKWTAGQTCPDMETTCPEGTTCCPLQGGAYGCCPYPQATCCNDDKHCCPKGYTCELKTSQCVLGSYQIQSTTEQMVVCPDKSTQCPSSSTCCPLPNGSYGCCPYVKATCCTDDKHCCPEGYTCDLKASQCVPGSSQIQSSEQMVVCPDKSTRCPSSSTCCPLPNGGYGCCPYVKAVCCEDHLHCCPNDYTCDIKAQKCMGHGTGSMKLSVVQSGIQTSAPVKCLDNTHCSGGTTCCPIEGGYECCPIPEAVCCQDNKHCCPKNYHCDLEHKRCVMGQTSLPLFEKFLPSKSLTAVEPAKKSIKFVMCPDYSECPDRNTCCLMNTGAWGCCPFMNAVCCIDREHCCPKTYFCDMEQSKCVSAKSSINPMFSMFSINLKPLKKSIP